MTAGTQGSAAVGAASQPAAADRSRRRRRGVGLTLARRILAINLVVLAVPVGGVLYLGEYRERLVKAQLAQLSERAQLIVTTMREVRRLPRPRNLPHRRSRASAERAARPSLTQWVGTQQIALIGRSGPQGRVRMFSIDGRLVLDTDSMKPIPGSAPAAGSASAAGLLPARGPVRVEQEPLPSPSALSDAVGRLQGRIEDALLPLLGGEPGALPGVDLAGMIYLIERAIDAALRWQPRGRPLEAYREAEQQSAAHYDEVVAALAGQAAWQVRDAGRGRMILSVAVPVTRVQRVIGALMVSSGSEEIESNLRAARLDILYVSVLALAVTVMLSLVLAATIARPIRRLAGAADRLSRSKNRQIRIPDYTARRDEIGELSGSLREMTEALWSRMDAIESFAADVAHEIKNPLTKLRSTIETTSLISDPEHQRTRIAAIAADVDRLDRLIVDIADASRLDAELSRTELEPVDLRELLAVLVEVEATETGPEFVLDLPPTGALRATGHADRLGRVFVNIVRNAVSFSPPDGRIAISVTPGTMPGGSWKIVIDDDGPGIRPGSLFQVFERFHSSRPEDDSTVPGEHSGLGLAIARQIVQAAGGVIRAENRPDGDGRVAGARFVVELPVSP